MCNIISNILATQLSTVDYVYAYGRRCTFRNGILLVLSITFELLVWKQCQDCGNPACCANLSCSKPTNNAACVTFPPNVKPIVALCVSFK